MKAAPRKLTHARLLEVLLYNQETGLFAWIGKRHGAVAGTINKVDNYCRIMVDYELILAHRLAWFYVYGTWPSGEVDHKNRNRADNRWCNLRDGTHANNQHNTSLRPNNRSGFKGVSWRRGDRWWAKIRVNGKRHSLGVYDCAAAAHFAYVVSADKYHGEFARP